MPEPELTPGMYGPDITFCGMPRTTLDDLADGGLDIAIVGAPFDGGTSHRPGTRFGPQAIEALSGIAWRRRLLAGDPARPARRPESPLLEGRG